MAYSGNILLISTLFFLMAGPAGAQPLVKHRWQHRVVLIFAEATTDSSMREQLAVLRKHEAGLHDRDLVIYQVGRNAGIAPFGKKLSAADVQALRQKYAKDYPAFRFILVGKDGGEKWCTDDQATIEALFARIDRMPMRRAEMRRQKKDNNGGHND